MQVTDIKLHITNTTTPLPRSKQLRLSRRMLAPLEGLHLVTSLRKLFTQRATLPGKCPKRLFLKQSRKCAHNSFLKH